MGAGILKLSLGECYRLTLAAQFGCTPAISSILTVNIPCSTIVRVTKLRLLEKRKNGIVQNCAGKKIYMQPGTCVDDFGTGVYLSSGKGMLLASSDIVAEK